MTKLERIKRRGEDAAERSGNQSESWERERELNSVRRDIYRMLRSEDYAIGMGGPMWWRD